MVVDNFTFLPEDASGIKIGNVFYNHGLVTLTRNSDIRLINTWDLTFKSTETIYEHEYLLIVNESDYNVSTNPTAVESVVAVVSSVENPLPQEVSANVVATMLRIKNNFFI